MVQRRRQVVERRLCAAITVVFAQIHACGRTPPVINHTLAGDLQADWELGNLYLQIEIIPEPTIRCCLAGERRENVIGQELNLEVMKTC